MDKYYIGMMSGTSLDAVDTVLTSFADGKIEFLASHSNPIPNTLKDKILKLCFSSDNEIEVLGALDRELGELFAVSCLQLMEKAKISPRDVQAIGSHGQTIRHRPFAQVPFTLQIGDPNTIAEKTGITVVADFRRRDMVLGGQGAPLVPGFHDYLFKHRKDNYWVLNIGGIANLTWLPKPPERKIFGFDTGPGNMLMDAWCLQHKGNRFDEDGQWAGQGKVSATLLEMLLSDPYFAKKPPKSTGREYFNLAWIKQHLDKLPVISPEDVQATLLELTARTITQAILEFKEKSPVLWVCGGGIKNQALMQRIRDLAIGITVSSTAEVSIDPQWIEACAFAWLAYQTMNNQTSNIPTVTGASHATILGAIYPKWV